MSSRFEPNEGGPKPIGVLLVTGNSSLFRFELKKIYKYSAFNVWNLMYRVTFYLVYLVIGICHKEFEKC